MRQREAYFDNGKFLLIFLVVFGHLIRSFIEDNASLFAMYSTIYAFHMPAFILISGHFAKATLTKKRLIHLIKRLLIPYLIFQIFYAIFYSVFISEPLNINLLIPEWSLWFLLSSFFWHLMLPAFAKMNKSFAMGIAILLGVLIGYVDLSNGFLSIARTFVFFPFFLLGYYMKRESFHYLKNKKFIFPAVNIIVGIFVYFYLNNSFDFTWLYGSKPYMEMKSITMFPVFDRLIIYLLNLILVMSFLALIPTKEYRFTILGQYTMYVYLIHGFIVRSFRSSEIAQWLANHHLTWTFVIIAILVIIAVSNKYVRTITQPIIELRTNNLREFRRRLHQHLQT